MRPRSRAAHRSIRALFAGLPIALAAACHEDAVVTTRTVTAFVPSACPVTGAGYATYTALGDFEPPGAPTGLFLSAKGAALSELDAASLELVVTTTQGGATWTGLTEVPASGDVDVLLMPQNASCALTAQVAGGAGSTLWNVGGERVILLGPAVTGGERVPPTYVGDLSTGAVTEASPPLQTQRSSASATPFGDGALVAGGVSPSNLVQDGAEVYSPTLGGFDASQAIKLSEPRAHHAAAVLADGRTLLAGGSADAAGTQVLGTLEAVDPSTHQAREENLATLIEARVDPALVRLASGEILVVGGAAAGGVPTQTVEWISADATAVSSASAPWGGARATAIALPAGGALVVVTPPAGAPSEFQTTWIVGEGANHSISAAAPVPRVPTRPVLFGGAGGAPLLWTGDAWLSWQPYAASFTSFPSLDVAAPDVGDAACSPDAGLAMWLDPSQGRLVGLRFATDNAYSPVPSSPLGALAFTAPDRLPGPGIAVLDDTALTLGAGAGAFVTDRTYADFDAVLTGVSGKPAPRLALRDASGHELVVPDDCGQTPPAGAVSRLEARRAGQTLTFAVNGAALATCRASFSAGDRVSVGVRGAKGIPASAASRLTVVRSGMP